MDVTNLTDTQYANIGNQVKFMDTIKYYQQSLSCLALSANEVEKGNIKKSIQNLIKKHKYSSSVFDFLTYVEKNRILSYLREGKRVITHGKIKCHSFLFTAPEQGKFFKKKKEFYNLLKNEITSESDFEDVKKIYSLMHMQNLSDLNDIYNMQDTILLYKIFENRAMEIIKNVLIIRANHIGKLA